MKTAKDRIEELAKTREVKPEITAADIRARRGGRLLRGRYISCRQFGLLGEPKVEKRG